MKYLIFSIICFSCTNNNKLEQTDLIITDSIANISSTGKKSSIENESTNKKYIFVVLTVIENTGLTYDESGIVHAFQPEKKFSVTDIVEEYDFISDDKKARIQDQVVNNYLTSISAKTSNGKISKKEIFIFDTYKEASEKRNNFLIN